MKDCLRAAGFALRHTALSRDCAAAELAPEESVRALGVLHRAFFE